MGVVIKRAKYFITCKELSMMTVQEIRPENLRRLFLNTSKEKKKNSTQLQLLFPD
jgi:predicted DNA-binding helix-hairpin-helix protein